MRWALLLVLCALGCATAPPPRSVSLQAPDCPLADPIIENIAAPTISSIEDPTRRAIRTPYEDWTDYDRGVVATYLADRFPDLDEPTILGALFSGTPHAPSSDFKRWLQLEAFSPSMVVFLLRNYTALPAGDLNARIRRELGRWHGRKFADWLTVAVALDPSPDLTRYILDLHLAHEMSLQIGSGCRYGSWCTTHLGEDLSPTDAGAVIRAFADQGRNVVALFPAPRAIYQSDAAGWRREAGSLNERGRVAAMLVLRSGDAVAIAALLGDPHISEEDRALWARDLASNPPPEPRELIAKLRTDPALPEAIRTALSAPGTVGMPYRSCAERVALLANSAP